MPIGMEVASWRVFTEVIWPNAHSAEAIMLALDYCKVRKLDPMKKPVHIVPVWDSKKNGYVEGIWSGINEQEVTAARTGEFGGMDPALYGPMIEREFKGKVKEKGNWRDHSIKVSFPEFCSRTVYRIVKGTRCPFTETVFWLEEYARLGGPRSELPNMMWAKRPRGQLAKVAKAAALRAAFPEEEGSQPSAEEMEGQDIAIEAADITPPPAEEQKPSAGPRQQQERDDLDEVIGGGYGDDDHRFVDAEPSPAAHPELLKRGAKETWPEWSTRFLKVIELVADLDTLEEWMTMNKNPLDVMRKEDAACHKATMQAVQQQRITVMPDASEGT